jgi:broad specificity phosphatase PhoE
MSETVLILARHGATSSNLQKPYILQGRKLDPELTPLGRQQSRALAWALLTQPVRHVYCSPLRRGLQTADLVSAPHGVPVEQVEGLTECDLGEWEGLAWEAVAQRWPEEERRFRENAEVHGYVGGENLGQVRDRTLPVVEGLVARQQEGVLVIVGHNVVNRVLLAHWLGIPLAHARKLPQSNGGHNVVVFEDGKARVRTLNAADYLRDCHSS